MDCATIRRMAPVFDSRLLLTLSLSIIRAAGPEGSSPEGREPDIKSLVEKHHRYLLALLQFKSGDDDTAMDLLQDTYVSFLNAVLGDKNPGRWSDDTKVRNYLITIALNKVRDHFRVAKRRSGEWIRFRTNEEMDDWLDNAASTEPNAADAIAEADERSRFRAYTRLAMERLDDRDRAVLDLKFSKGFDNPGITASMGIGVKAVESLLFRAKRRFRSEFEKIREESE